jgi:NCS1 family nucleobase:cation symporter-1
MAVETQQGGLRWLPRIEAPPEWGIEPVPPAARRLGFLDFFVLWADLGVGLLVLLAGTFLIPGLGLGQALVAIVVGTLIGNLLLALAGLVGSGQGIPTMVALRPSLGIRGSLLPTALNVIQLIGWGSFEVIIMAQAADGISQALFGFSNRLLWTAVFALIVTAMAISGPHTVVKQWLEKFAVWLVLLTTAGLTGYLLTHYDVGALLRQPGTGDLSFWLAVDLVVAMPVSWLPLVADYNRFARDDRSSFLGTYAGYFIANVWFYALGALMVLALKPENLIASFMALTAGWVALLIILVDETDNAFADIYSTAVSLQNAAPKVKQWMLAAGVGIICFLLAATVDVSQYEGFLLLIGSVFVPLFGVLAADYFILRGRHYDAKALYQAGSTYWYQGGVNWLAVVAWALGVAAYQFISHGLPWLGASIPSFLVALVAHWLLARLTRGRINPAPGS